MIFNMMNYSGGGSVEDAYAIIRVTYPVGSDCTCTKDETGGMVLEAADKTGIAMFAVPESGRWIVTSTDGTHTASDAVNANTRLAVYEVTLAYEPAPTPTPTETKIVASGYIVGAINATELNGDWNGGDVVIGTSAEWVVPNTGTYVVVYVPGDNTGAKTYFVNVTTEGNTYALNLQTGAVEEIAPSPDPEPVTTTVLTVTFPAGSVSLASTSRVPIDSASGSAASNTKTFNLTPGTSDIVTYSGTSGAYNERTITASGETMTVSFNSSDRVSFRVYVRNLTSQTQPTLKLYYEDASTGTSPDSISYNNLSSLWDAKWDNLAAGTYTVTWESEGEVVESASIVASRLNEYTINFNTST